MFSSASSRFKILDGRIEAAAADPQLGVVVVALAEQGAVYGQYADPASADLGDLYRPTGRVLRKGPDAAKVAIVPAHELALLLQDVHLGNIWPEVGIPFIPPAATDIVDG